MRCIFVIRAASGLEGELQISWSLYMIIRMEPDRLEQRRELREIPGLTEAETSSHHGVRSRSPPALRGLEA